MGSGMSLPADGVQGTHSTRGDVPIDMGQHIGPPVIGLEQVVHALGTGVASG